ncbi:isochorismate synthase [Halobacteriales archaeon SW_5_70_135]|nr:MAG: isochorismate synthase [Halobacteriales archaeon SW_5_70_135]
MGSVGGDGPAAAESTCVTVGAGAVPRGVRADCREVGDVSYRALLEAFNPPHTYWSTPDGLEVAGVGSVATLVADGPDRFDRLRAAADRLFETVAFDGPAVARPRAIGGLAFHADHRPEPPWESFPAAGFVLPETLLVRGDDRTLLTAVTPADGDALGDTAVPTEPATALSRAVERVADLPSMRPTGAPPGVRSRRTVTGREAWTAGVERLRGRIDAGDLRKAVLATALEVDTEAPVVPADTLERLRRTHPDCFRFLVRPDGRAFFGAPPERLVALDGRDVRAEALAGTVPRGDDPAEDEELAARLLADEKIAHEQRLVVEAVRERLAPLGELWTDDRRVRRLAGVQHLETPIGARLATDRHVLDLVESLHPTPAVGGLPADLAAGVVRETEPFERGWYAGPVGWFDAAGDGEFAVAIRSGVAADRRVTLFAGNGIVADSDPGDEWDEVNLKWPVLDELRR